jgi:hypothetical protein
MAAVVTALLRLLVLGVSPHLAATGRLWPGAVVSARIRTGGDQAARRARPDDGAGLISSGGARMLGAGSTALQG